MQEEYRNKESCRYSDSEAHIRKEISVISRIQKQRTEYSRIEYGQVDIFLYVSEYFRHKPPYNEQASRIYYAHHHCVYKRHNDIEILPLGKPAVNKICDTARNDDNICYADSESEYTLLLSRSVQCYACAARP